MRLSKKTELAIQWLKENSLEIDQQRRAIATTTKLKYGYPEVTGYLIPTLIAWGERDLAAKYANWIISIQGKDGSFTDPTGKYKMVFDTGQIVRGLIACKGNLKIEGIDIAINRAIDWMLSVTTTQGIDAPDFNQWGGAVPPQVFLYAFAPIWNHLDQSAGDLRKNKIWEIIESIIELKIDGSIKSLNHFHCYFIAGLLEINHIDYATELMNNMEKCSLKNGEYLGRQNGKWICSTGQFQIADIWYRLGKLEKGNLALEIGAIQQNKSGGWFGSYSLNNFTSRFFKFSKSRYFPNSEISWSNKYFLDAVEAKLKLEFELMHSVFPDEISSKDGRLLILQKCLPSNSDSKILDVGCGKGRYLKHLNDGHRKLVGMDISSSILSLVPEDIETRLGSITKIEAKDGEFDFIYTIECLEHCVHLEGAVNELVRVTKDGGSFLIIDKHKNRIRSKVWKIPDWEQWFRADTLAEMIIARGFIVQIIKEIRHEDSQSNIFFALICTKVIKF